MAQLGHADPGFTLRVYAHAMRYSDDERARLRALVEGGETAPIGTSSPDHAPAPLRLDASHAAETPR
jgi:hypothetical protein